MSFGTIQSDGDHHTQQQHNDSRDHRHFYRGMFEWKKSNNKNSTLSDTLDVKSLNKSSSRQFNQF